MVSKSRPFVMRFTADDTVTTRALSWEGDALVAANRAGRNSCVYNQWPAYSWRHYYMAINLSEKINTYRCHLCRTASHTVLL